MTPLPHAAAAPRSHQRSPIPTFLLSPCCPFHPHTTPSFSPAHLCPTLRSCLPSRLLLPMGICTRCLHMPLPLPYPPHTAPCLSQHMRGYLRGGSTVLPACHLHTFILPYTLSPTPSFNSPAATFLFTPFHTTLFAHSSPPILLTLPSSCDTHFSAHATFLYSYVPAHTVYTPHTHPCTCHTHGLLVTHCGPFPHYPIHTFYPHLPLPPPCHTCHPASVLPFLPTVTWFCAITLLI